MTTTTLHQSAMEVRTPRGTLRGMIYRPEAGPIGRAPAVMLLHGFSGARTSNGFMLIRLARQLAERGIAAVTFDFMNSGESDGLFEATRVTEQVDDTLRVLQWLQGQQWADRSRVGLFGFSLGGLVACCVQARARGIRAVALLAPTTVDNLCRHAGASAWDEPVIIGPHKLPQAYFTDLRTLDPLRDAAAKPCPTLLVQGLADTLVPPAVSEEYAAVLRDAGGRFEHVDIPEADHGFSHPTTRQQMQDAVVPWLRDRLCD